MRKQLKKALSMFLSAAMVVTMGSGLGSLTNTVAANAAEPVDSFELSLSYTGTDASGGDLFTLAAVDTITVTGNGDYTMAINGEDTVEGGDYEMTMDAARTGCLYIDSDLTWTSTDGDGNLYNDEGLPIFKVTSISIASTSGEIKKTYYPYTGNECFGYQDGKVKNPLRTQVINKYSYPFDESGLDDDMTYDAGVTWIDADGDGTYDDNLALAKGETMLLNVHVTGMAQDGVNADTGRDSYYQQYHAYTTVKTDAEEKTQDTLITGDGSYGLPCKLTADATSLETLTIDSNLFVSADAATEAGIQITPTYVTVADEGAKAEEAGIYKVDPAKLEITGSETEGLSYDLTNALDKDFSAKAEQIVTVLYEVAGTGIKNPAANVTLDSASQDQKEPDTPAAPPAAATKAPIDTSAKASYDAYLGFQTKGFCFREAWNHSDYGVKATKMKYSEQIGVDGGTSFANAKITNAVIAENNKEYTISISDVDLKTLEAKCNATDKGKFNMIFISTNIPLAMKGVTFSNATLKIDGTAVKTYKTVPQKADVKDYYQVMLADAYAPDDGTKDAEYPSGKELATMPTKSIEVTFTVTGANFNQDFSTKTIGTKKGKTFTKGNFKYKVTTAATETAGKKKAGKVSVVGLSAKGKKAKKLSVPATVKKTGSYKVSALAKNALKGAKKATSITLSKNIKKIPAGAFKNCKKLKKLTLKAKLSSVNKKAFTGCKKTIKVAGTSKKKNLKKIKKVYKKAK